MNLIQEIRSYLLWSTYSGINTLRTFDTPCQFAKKIKVYVFCVSFTVSHKVNESMLRFISIQYSLRGFHAAQNIIIVQINQLRSASGVTAPIARPWLTVHHTQTISRVQFTHIDSINAQSWTWCACPECSSTSLQCRAYGLCANDISYADVYARVRWCVERTAAAAAAAVAGLYVYRALETGLGSHIN